MRWAARMDDAGNYLRRVSIAWVTRQMDLINADGHEVELFILAQAVSDLVVIVLEGIIFRWVSRLHTPRVFIAAF